MNKEKYWVIVASKDHAQIGLLEGCTQACHGKEEPLKRMKVNDWVLIYSPKQLFNNGDKYQKFAAIGKVPDDIVYQVEISSDFKPYRRNITWYDCEEVSILPLIPQLEFIQNKQQWGYPFRYGFFEINEVDFNVIASQMLQHQCI
jgi:hypothetical protein